MKIPAAFLLHPVGTGSTRSMNVLSARMWVRFLVDTLPDIVIAAPWLAYADANIDRERGIRDALVMLDHCDAVVAVGGEFSRGMEIEWERARANKLVMIDLTRPPMPGLLTGDSFSTITPQTRAAVGATFHRHLEPMKAAA